MLIICVCSSVVERCPDKTEVLGPIPSTRTRPLSLFFRMDNKEKTKIEAPWWRDGVIIFARVSAYIALPIIMASYIGKYLDQKYDTGNLLFLVLIIVAFLSTIYLIWKEMKIYKRKMDKEDKNKFN